MKELTVKCLYDVGASAEAILKFTSDLSFDAYCENDLVRSAVERKFEVIGEALRRIRDEDPDSFSNIEYGREIVGMRNRLIHGYDSVDEEIVWETIEVYLPKLVLGVNALFD